MVVLDTDILVGVLRKNIDAQNFLERLEKKNEIINTTVINAFELLEGALLYPGRDKSKSAEILLRSLGSYSFNGPASWTAAQISAELKKSGKIIDFPDLAIASIAISRGEPLVTRNVKHFERIKGLRIEKW